MTRLGDDVVARFDHGSKSSIGTSAVQLVASSTPATRGVLVRAAHDNTGTVYVGASSSVTANSSDATDGLPLAAGDSLLVKVDDANKVYLIANTTGQKVFFLTV
ncbi:MAG: hypothetical protein R3C10_03670 [Pirellulales bacterium]|nr:hypothetical protein [Planctomycetales bacterium]